LTSAERFAEEPHESTQMREGSIIYYFLLSAGCQPITARSRPHGSAGSRSVAYSLRTSPLVSAFKKPIRAGAEGGARYVEQAIGDAQRTTPGFPTSAQGLDTWPGSEDHAGSRRGPSGTIHERGAGCRPSAAPRNGSCAIVSSPLRRRPAVEKKVRRHLMHARQREGFGWTRWSRQWLYQNLKLFNGYRVRRPQPKVAPAG
jgi:hypothetical protein